MLFILVLFMVPATLAGVAIVASAGIVLLVDVGLIVANFSGREDG